MSVGTVSRFESGQGVPEMTVGLFQRALERAGAEFVIDGADVGVWLRKGAKGAEIPIDELNAANEFLTRPRLASQGSFTAPRK